MSTQETRQTKVRMAVVDGLLTVSDRLCRLASRLDPGPMGEPCPDCGVPTTIPPDEPCPECEARYEQKRRDEKIYGSGYEDGRTAASRAAMGEGDW